MKPLFHHTTGLLMVLIVLTNCQSNKTSDTESATSTGTTFAEEIIVTKTQFQSSGMQLGKVSEHTFTTSVQANGYLEVTPSNYVKISPVMGGYIQKIDLLEGTLVKRGEFLFSLTNPEYVDLQQQYLEIFEQLPYLKSEYERQKTLAEERIAAEKNFIKAKSEYKSAMATYKGLKEKLSMLKIDPNQIEKGQIQPSVNVYAPISGYVSNVGATQGAYMTSSDVILEIINTKDLHLELQVFEKDILNIKPGNPIEFKIPETGDQVFKGTMHLVGRSISEEDRTVLVHGDLISEYPQLIRGMYVEANIITDTIRSFALDNEAVVEDGENKYALVYKEERADSLVFNKYQLNIGQSDHLMTQILNTELFENDPQILVKGAFNLVGIN